MILHLLLSNHLLCIVYVAALFVDVPPSHSVLDHAKLTYLYDEIDTTATDTQTQVNCCVNIVHVTNKLITFRFFLFVHFLVKPYMLHVLQQQSGSGTEQAQEGFAKLRPWIDQFLAVNQEMVAASVGTNKLVKEVSLCS